MPYLRKTFGCPVELSLEVLGGKWKPIILARLKDQPMRYGQLRRLIPDLSDKVLTQRLRDLTEAGLIETREEGSAAFYALTERGQSLRPILEALHSWGSAAAVDLGARFRAITSPEP